MADLDLDSSSNSNDKYDTSTHTNTSLKFDEAATSSTVVASHNSTSSQELGSSRDRSECSILALASTFGSELVKSCVSVVILFLYVTLYPIWQRQYGSNSSTE